MNWSTVIIITPALNMLMLYAEDSFEIKELREFHRDLWMKINKPMGWEVFDGRYGFLLMRLDTAIYRIREYLDGKIGAIPELEQERLYFQGERKLGECNIYNRMPTASRISMTTFYLF